MHQWGFVLLRWHVWCLQRWHVWEDAWFCDSLLWC